MLEDFLPTDPRTRRGGWFDLEAPVGLGFPTSRRDAIRLEGLLANTGDHDLAATDGPTGYWGIGLDKALRRYQKRNGLTVDGWLAPDGETIAHMRQALTPALEGADLPEPAEIDAHHDALAAGEPGLIALAPDGRLAPVADLPDIGAAGRAANARQIDWLARNRTGLDGVPEQLARYVRELGPEGTAQARDFVDQFAAIDAQGADRLVDGVLRLLPDGAARTGFLGRAPGGGTPPGARLPKRQTKEMRTEDEVQGPAMRNLLLRADEAEHATLAAEPNDQAERTTTSTTSDAEKGGDVPQSAQVKPAEPWYARIPAYRADVLGKQADHWNSVRDSVAGNPALGEGQRAAYLSIFAAEGGMAKDPTSNAVAGITQGFIEDSRKAGTWPSALDHVRTPSDLKPADVPAAMTHYFDKAFPRLSGAAALDTIPDSRVAAAVADTLYRDGTYRGTRMVQDALKNAGGPQESDGVFGSRTLDAVRALAKNPESAASLLDALAAIRNPTRPSEQTRIDYFRFRPR
jgi:hypothetical protein